MDKTLDMVLTGKADAMMADKPFCVVADFHNKDKDLEVSQMFTFEPLGVALPANDVHLINWVENFFMTIQGNGTLERLTQPDRTKVPKVVVCAFSAVNIININRWSEAIP
jgi:ABC-type amino acid transport substrate-binding protein